MEEAIILQAVASEGRRGEGRRARREEAKGVDADCRGSRR